jgi:hypothetical protein
VSATKTLKTGFCSFYKQNPTIHAIFHLFCRIWPLSDILRSFQNILSDSSDNPRSKAQILSQNHCFALAILNFSVFFTNQAISPMRTLPARMCALKHSQNIPETQ